MSHSPACESTYNSLIASSFLLVKIEVYPFLKSGFFTGALDAVPSHLPRTWNPFSLFCMQHKAEVDLGEFKQRPDIRRVSEGHNNGKKAGGIKAGKGKATSEG